MRRRIKFRAVRVETKSNEITAILDTIDCKGSIDAIGCQQGIVSAIRDKEADYVICLKKNQQALYEQAYDFMQRKVADLPVETFVNKDHGRGEIRRVYVANTIDLIDQRDAWRDLNSIIMIERARIADEVTQTSTALYISSLENRTPLEMSGFVRNHWQIEKNFTGT